MAAALTTVRDSALQPKPKKTGKLNRKEVPHYVAFSLYTWKLLEESGLRKLFPELLKFSHQAV